MMENIKQLFQSIIDDCFKYQNRGGMGFLTNEINKAVANVGRAYDKFTHPTCTIVSVVSEQALLIYYQAINTAFDKVNREELGFLNSEMEKAALQITMAHFTAKENTQGNVDYLKRVYVDALDTNFRSPDSRQHIYQAMHNMHMDGVDKKEIINGFGGNPRPTELMYNAFMELNSKPKPLPCRTISVFERARILAKLANKRK
jgi:hypothetical protein